MSVEPKPDPSLALISLVPDMVEVIKAIVRQGLESDAKYIGSDTMMRARALRNKITKIETAYLKDRGGGGNNAI